MTNVTVLENDIDNVDAKTPEQLLPLVYDELRQLATRRLASEAPGHTLQPTALVHEAWLRLVSDRTRSFENRAHFFAVAAEAMRHILIDRARQKRAVRHGGGQRRVELEDVDMPLANHDDQLLAVSEALDELSSRHALEAEVVKLRYFVGMTNEEAAEALGISVRTAKYYWTHARAWLYQTITASFAS